jgi:hypothetical protein
MEKEGPMSEPQASFGPSHFLTCTIGNPQGSDCCGRLFSVTFFGEAKKLTSRRSTTGRQSYNNEKN